MIKNMKQQQQKKKIKCSKRPSYRSVSANKKPPLVHKRQLQMRRHCTCICHILVWLEIIQSDIHLAAIARACELIFLQRYCRCLFSIVFHTESQTAKVK